MTRWGTRQRRADADTNWKTGRFNTAQTGWENEHREQDPQHDHDLYRLTGTSPHNADCDRDKAQTDTHTEQTGTASSEAKVIDLRGGRECLWTWRRLLERTRELWQRNG